MRVRCGGAVRGLRCKGAGVQRCGGAGRGAGVQGWKGAGVQTCNSFSSRTPLSHHGIAAITSTDSHERR